jgi:6-phosphofructokinase
MEGKLGILVGGGPAPGINSVIGAATIRSALQGVPVIGIQDGFEGLMRGRIDRIRPLTIDDVSRIHFRGGSVLGISRANPTKDPKYLEAVVDALNRLGITRLITIGGDDTAFSASRVADCAADRLRVVHVPKTIDNDLDLPPDIDTFGFQTARHVGAELVKNLMVDAFTTSRWYLVISMGRKAGHLALGIGKAAGATITLIPEEFGPRVPLRQVVDTIVGAILKRQAYGRKHGIAVVAEGVVLSIDEKELGNLDKVEHDEHGHVRIAEIDVGDILKRAVQKELAALGIKATIVSKEIGYELRCADPIPYDMEYTRDLGYCAARYILSGGHAAMVSMQEGRFVPVPFNEMMDPQTGRTRVRLVDINSARYGIARRYMIRMRRDDFSNQAELERLAKTANLTPDEFRARFEPLTAIEPKQLDIGVATADVG